MTLREIQMVDYSRKEDSQAINPQAFQSINAQALDDKNPFVMLTDRPQSSQSNFYMQRNTTFANSQSYHKKLMAGTRDTDYFQVGFGEERPISRTADFRPISRARGNNQ